MPRLDRCLVLPLLLAGCSDDGPGLQHYLWAQVQEPTAEPHKRFGSFLEVTWGQQVDAESAWIEYRLPREETWRRTPAMPRVRACSQRFARLAASNFSSFTS